MLLAMTCCYLPLHTVISVPYRISSCSHYHFSARSQGPVFLRIPLIVLNLLCLTLPLWYTQGSGTTSAPLVVTDPLNHKAAASQPTSKLSQPACLRSSLPACYPGGLPTIMPVLRPACHPVGLLAILPACLSSCQPSCHSAFMPVTYHPAGLSAGLPIVLPASSHSCQPDCHPAGLPTILPVCMPFCHSTCQPAGLPAIPLVFLPSSLQF